MFTDKTKWHSIWWNGLTPHGKLMFFYITESVVDISGIGEWDVPRSVFETGLTQEEAERAFKEISRIYEKAKGNSNWIRVKSFLIFQNNWPINERNPCHRGILKLIRRHSGLFPNLLAEVEKDLQSSSEATPGQLPSTASNSNGKSNCISKSNGNEEGKSKGEDNPSLWPDVRTKTKDILAENEIHTVPNSEAPF